MNKYEYLFTSESVTEGHPDKIADKISDSILDAVLKQDSNGRVAIETMIKDDTIVLAGEITTTAIIDYDKIAKKTVRDIGYTNDFKVIKIISQQSPDIALGVDLEGAGDQGMMFGYACKETGEYMPAPIVYAHRITKALTDYRKNNPNCGLKPDGKSQVTVEYINGKINRIDNIVVSAQHSESLKLQDLKRLIIENIIKKVIPRCLLEDTIFYINPTGKFVVGGPNADSGLTGRKIIVDTYGGYARVGGGAFSGKDPSKVDRSGAYMARYIAKNIVASGVCKKVEIGLSYAIGKKEPTSIMIDTFETGAYDEDVIVKMIKDVFPLTPKGIIEKLDLKKPIYAKVTNYGHFGNNTSSWEKLNMVTTIKKYFKERK